MKIKKISRSAKLAYQSWAFVLLIFLCTPAHNQKPASQLISYENEKISQVFYSVESQSEYIFNFDPEILGQLKFTGEFDLWDIEKSLTQVLRESIFDFELRGNSILIFPSDPLEYRICGTVLDQESAEPLLGANISIEGESIGVASDEYGQFELSVIIPKNRVVRISYIGFETKNYFASDWADAQCKKIYLAVDDDLLNQEIIIEDYLIDGINEGQSHGGYDMQYDQLARFHASVENDILKTVQLLSGITSLDESAANLQIRGGSPDQNLILWEGATIYNSGHLFGMISAINPYAVDRVEIFKATYDASIDNRVGALVDISLSDSIVEGFSGSIGATMTEAHFNASTAVVKDQLSISVAGRQSLSSLFSSPPFESYSDRVFQFSRVADQEEDSAEGFLETDQQIGYNDLSAKIVLKPSDRIYLSSSLYNNAQNFKYSFSLIDDPFITRDDVQSQSTVWSTNLALRHSVRSSTMLTYNISAYNSNHDFVESELGMELNDIKQRNLVRDQSWSLSHYLDISDKIKLEGGYDYSLKRVEYDLLRNGESSSFSDEDFNQSRIFNNIFLNSSYQRDRFSLDVGARLTKVQANESWRFSPRANLHLGLTKHVKYKLQLGVFHQFISQLREYDQGPLRVDNPIWILGAEESEVSQRAMKISSGMVFHDEGWLIDLEAYWNQIDGINTLTPLFNPVGDAFFTKGESTARGIDLLVKKKWKRLQTWANYSHARHVVDIPDLAEQSYFAPNDIRHSLSFVLNYELNNWSLSSVANYRSGLPYTPAVEIIERFNDEMEIEFYEVGLGEINSRRLKEYIRFDFNVNYRPRMKKHVKRRSEFSVSLINILDRANVFARSYFIQADEENLNPQISFVESLLLPRTPLASFRFNW